MGLDQHVLDAQKYFQSKAGYIHTRGRADRLFSTLIPLGFAAFGTVNLVQGLYHMYTGTGKKEDA